jgi:lysophospholipase L1-like esterase
LAENIDPIEPSGLPRRSRFDWPRKVLLNVMLMGASFVFALFLAEGILRIVFPIKENRGRLLEDLPADPIQYRLIPGGRAVYYGAEVEVNDSGYRGVPLAEATSETELRVLVLGDSMTFGNGVGELETYPVHLARWLSDHAQGWEARSANLGVPSYNAEQVAIQLREKGIPLHPDLVVYGFFVNDAAPKGTSIHWARPDPGRVQSLVGNSHLVRFLQSQAPRRVTEIRQALGLRARSDGYNEYYREESQTWEACRNSLREIRDVCRSAEVPLAVVLIPFWVDFRNYPWADCHRAVYRELEKLGVPVLDLAQVWGERGINGRDYWIDIHQSHPTGEGYQLLTETLGDFLIHQVWAETTLGEEYPVQEKIVSELDPKP